MTPLFPENKELHKLQLVFKHNPGEIFILEKDFKFEYVNPGFVKLSGYSKEELLSRIVGQLFYHKDLPESRNEIVKSILNEKNGRMNYLPVNFCFIVFRTGKLICKSNIRTIRKYILPVYVRHTKGHSNAICDIFSEIKGNVFPKINLYEILLILA